MKFALVAVVCLALVAVIVAENARPRDHKRRTPAPPPSRAPSKRCSDQSDCGDDECCVGLKFRSGKCRKLLREGKRCLRDNTAPSGKYTFACPCAEGLSCVSERVTQNKFGKVRNNERCRAPSASTVPPTEGVTEEDPKVDSDESTESSEEKR
nr:toxin CSTX-20-like [Parasteatoda tepidariorum]